MSGFWDNETEAEIFTERGIEKTGENTYRIIGRPYTIRFMGRTDDGDGLLWECDCPAGEHGKECKHVKLVWSANNEYCDAMGYD